MEQFGRYQLIRKIGSGGMAEVFLARTLVARGLSKELVIKKILPSFAKSKHFVSMFVDEAKIALGLNHPNIAQVFDFGSVDGTFYLAMEYVDGIDLLRLLKGVTQRQTRVPIGHGCRIIHEVCRGLQYAHKKADDFGTPLEIVHRDISPQNILISSFGNVKLVDFGIARARWLNEEEGIVKGKFAYMSPEQAKGQPVDATSDIYSAAIILFELVTGRPVFQGKDKELLKKVKTGAIPRPRDFNDDIPDSLERIIIKALAYHRQDRFQSARDFQLALSGFLLERAQTMQEIVDESALVDFVSQIIAPAGRSRSLSLSLPFEEMLLGNSQPGVTRERKGLFLLSGTIISDHAAEVTQVLETDFGPMLDDIAYKYHAHIQQQPAPTKTSSDSSFTLLLGVPVSGEDDAQQIIALGRTLIEAFSSLAEERGLAAGLSIGIHRGTATLSWHDGEDFSCELSEHSVAVITALAKTAGQNQLLASSAMYRVLRHEWHFTPVPELPLPVDILHTDSGSFETSSTPSPSTRAYRVGRPKLHSEKTTVGPGGTSTFVGRNLERKALVDVFRDVTLGQRKRLALVVGEQGIGKRSLVNNFIRGLDSDRVSVIRATARASTAFTPYSVIADFARNLLAVSDNDDPVLVRKKIDELIPLMYSGVNTREAKGAKQIAYLLLGVGSELNVGAPLENTQTNPTSPPPPTSADKTNEQTNIQTIDPEERRQRLLDLMFRIESRIARDKTLVLIGEDIHWADAESRSLFKELMARDSGRAVLGITTLRPTGELEKWAQSEDAMIVRLGELDTSDITSLILDAFENKTEAEPLAKKIIARTGGNPLFALEVLEDLKERGIVSVTSPKDTGDAYGSLSWQAQSTKIVVPPSVDALIASRLDRLPPEEKRVLMHASVLGQTFLAEDVSSLAGSDTENFLLKLRDRGILAATGSEFRFKNYMAMTVAYQMLPNDERQRLHRVAAIFIRDSKAYRPGQDDALIARHLELAGQKHQAAQTYLSAVQHAIAVGGLSDALRQLTRVAKLLDDNDAEGLYPVYKEQEHILHSLGRRSEQFQAIQRLRRYAEELADAGKLAHAYSRLAAYHLDSGRNKDADEAVQTALAHARASGRTLVEAEAIRLQAEATWQLGNPDKALVLCTQALRLCDQGTNDMMVRGEIVGTQGSFLFKTGHLESAIESFAEALVIYRSLGQVRLESLALNNMGRAFEALGEYEEALAHFKSSVKIDQELGDRSVLTHKLGNIGKTYVDLGDIDEAEKYLSKAVEIARYAPGGIARAEVLITYGQLYLQRAEIVQAKIALRKGYNIAVAQGDPFQQIRAQVYLAWTLLDGHEHPQSALELAIKAGNHAEEIQVPVGLAYATVLQAVALTRLGRIDEAAALATQATMVRRAHTRPEGREQILYLYAWVMKQAGRTEEHRSALLASHTEIEAKLQRLSSYHLKKTYRAARLPKAVLEEVAALKLDNESTV